MKPLHVQNNTHTIKRAPGGLIADGAASLLRKKSPQGASNKFDTKSSQELTACPYLSREEKLYLDPDGQFFLQTCDHIVDGRKLKRDEDFIGLCSELGIGFPDPKKRTRLVKNYKALSFRQALEWCVRTQIPEMFQATLLQAIGGKEPR